MERPVTHGIINKLRVEISFQLLKLVLKIAPDPEKTNYTIEARK